MKPTKKPRFRKQLNSQAGLTLLEAMIALTVLLVAAVGVLSLGSVALTTTENQGHLMARTAEYAQDKMEQLLALKFCDATSNTTVLPASNNGGTGLAGCPVPLVNPQTGTGGNGGSSNPAAPVDGYVDYLDANGNLLPTAGGGAPAGWKYMRVWQVASINVNAPNTVKRITVTVTVSSALGNAAFPQSTLAALKAYPF